MAAKVPKFYRDVLENMAKTGTEFPVPGKGSPICDKCVLDPNPRVAEGKKVKNANRCKNPYLSPDGINKPTITVVTDGISRKEDNAGIIAAEGTPKFLKGIFAKIIEREKLPISLDDIRFSPLTRCYPENGKEPKTAGRWCKNFLVQDLNSNRPQLIIPVGSVALGSLSHKSNVQDWGGRLLTYRGWPDDWITDSRFEAGHPIFGEAPNFRIPMVPIQTPGIVYSSQNQILIQRWLKDVIHALRLASDKQAPLIYDRDWWKIVQTENDLNDLLDKLDYLIQNPGTIVTYDTETTGLKPFLGEKIVTMMIRYTDKGGNPQAIGWPWDYPASPVLPYIDQLAPLILKALSVSKLRGHNLTFDLLFTIATVPGGLAYLDKLCEAFYQDSWHMLYARRQRTGSMGLEIVTYDWCPELAGYEEEMTLLIAKYPELLDPAAKKGGHYANCPTQYWQSHYRPYIMGDVETCHVACNNIEADLQNVKTYKIPLANPQKLGSFRHYSPISRATLYPNLLSRAGSTLAKMMARGMYIDQAELERQEEDFPLQIIEAKNKLLQENPQLLSYYKMLELEWKSQQQDSTATWNLDLEDKKILKTILFKELNLPITTLTEAGAKKFKSIEGISKDILLEFASTDKFTLNSLAVNHPGIRPLLNYRKVHKQYTTYIRTMRNITTAGIDKNDRKGYRMLMDDGCVHSTFKLTGTRTGRLASVEPNLQQVPRDGVIKRMYGSRFGKRGCVYQGDLSQVELRLLAAACGDPTMVKAYLDGVDLHSLTTAHVFKIPYENFSKEYAAKLQNEGRSDEAKKLEGKRKMGKTLNFLTGYGGGALGFQSALALQGVYVDLPECEQHLNGFFETYPYLKIHIGHYKKFIINNGVAVSITGRVRELDEVFSDDPRLSNKALRAGYNHLIQSTASDMMLCSLITIEAAMRDANLESMLVSTVHDSLVIDAVIEELPVIHEICTDVLNNIPTVMSILLGDTFDPSWACIPFTADVELGRNYLDCKKVPKNNPDWDKILA